MLDAKPHALDLGQRLLQRFGDHHRPVLAARAADGNGQIALALAHVVRQGELEERRQLVEEFLGRRARARENEAFLQEFPKLDAISDAPVSSDCTTPFLLQA